MRIAALLSLMLTLAACGVDGEPLPQRKVEPGVKVSGTATIGVSGSF